MGDTELVDDFLKKSITVDRGEVLQGLSERCIVKVFLKSYQPMSVESDFHGYDTLEPIN